MKREELITFISKLTNLSSGDKARLYNSIVSKLYRLEEMGIEFL
jgi:hypothetical protein